MIKNKDDIISINSKEVKKGVVGGRRERQDYTQLYMDMSKGTQWKR